MCEIKTETLLMLLVRRTISLIVRPIRAIVNYILKGTNLMTTAQEIVDGVADLKSAIEASATSISGINLKLDEVKAKIDALKAGSVVTQEILDEIGAGLSAAKSVAVSAKEEAEAVLAEASGLVAVEPA